MAYFAELDKNNIVVRVVSIANEKNVSTKFKQDYKEFDLFTLQSVSGNKVSMPNIVSDPVEWEDESFGKKFCNSLLGGEWVQTSYNNNFRKQFASIGYKYDKEYDVFIAPQPFESWKLNKNFDWEAPVKYPDDKNDYVWDEEKQQWVI